MAPKKLAITATQRLGKRVDGVENRIKEQHRLLEGLTSRVRELAKTLAETQHSGNWEAMYRIEREEVIRLRSQSAQSDAFMAWFDDWCYRMSTQVIDRLVPLKPPTRTAEAMQFLTDEEKRIVEKFGSELKKGLKKGEIVNSGPDFGDETFLR